MAIENPREFFDRVAVSVEPPGPGRLGYTPVKLWVYKGDAWVSMMVSVDDLEDSVIGRETMFSYLEQEMAEKLSEYV